MAAVEAKACEHSVCGPGDEPAELQILENIKERLLGAFPVLEVVQAEQARSFHVECGMVLPALSGFDYTRSTAGKRAKNRYACTLSRTEWGCDALADQQGKCLQPHGWLLEMFDAPTHQRTHGIAGPRAGRSSAGSSRARNLSWMRRHRSLCEPNSVRHRLAACASACPSFPQLCLPQFPAALLNAPRSSLDSSWHRRPRT